MVVHKPVGDVMLGLLGCTVVQCDISDGGFKLVCMLLTKHINR